MKHLIKFNENTMSSALYYFNQNKNLWQPGDYSGEQYIVLASSEKEALIYLKEHFFKKSKEKNFDDSYEEVYEKWKDCTVNSLPDKYEIDVFYEGDILETEINY